ncbi:MAG TPA: MFS transporter [Chthoniobacterales bacterium]|nr:MFS transporter [Chthoniobacterales bacterium]
MKFLTGRWGALSLLLLINLFSYIDRQVLAAVEPQIRETFFGADNRNAMAVTGILGTAFLVSYMIAAPALGWLADRFSRWVVIGCAIILWSLASGASGLAATFAILLVTRIFVGIGEGGYGPAAPTVLADLFSIETRGRVLAVFCAAVPVGTALGYIIGGLVSEHWGWRWAFYVVTPPGILLGILCFFQRDPRASRTAPIVQRNWPSREDYARLARTPSYVLNCIAQTAVTFAAGGIGFWIAAYLKYRGQPESATKFFGLIIVVAGLASTLLGGWAGDRLRQKYPGSYFLVSGFGSALTFPFFVAMLFTPFPAAWFLMFGAAFFLYLNTGPSNTALANVSLPKVRASAFALNLFVIHLFGDAASYPVIGFIAGHTNMTVAFLVVSFMLLIAAATWFYGIKYLPRDTQRVTAATQA